VRRTAAGPRGPASAAAPPAGAGWSWPPDPAAYDRAPDLRPEEAAALAGLVQGLDGGRPWPEPPPPALARLVRPVEDALAVAGATGPLRTAVLRAVAQETHRRGRVLWGWTHGDWVETLGATERQFRRRHRGSPDKRQCLIAVGYLLGGFTDWAALGAVSRLALARKVFGRARVDAAARRVLEAAGRLGYRRTVEGRLRVGLCAALLANRSPRLEDLTAARLAALRRVPAPWEQRGWYVLAQALFALGLIPDPPRPAAAPARPAATDPLDVAPEWVGWGERWRATSALPPASRAKYHRVLLRAGRWLARVHPEVRAPAQWTRDIAAAYVAAVDRATVGQWGRTTGLDRATVGKPLAARTRDTYLTAVRAFFRDLQDWGWIPRRFAPRRDLATPRAVRALVGPDPRVIADDLWAKLPWAGLNLAQDDLLAPRSGARGAYPLALVRALAVVWLFAGLRRNEIRRLRVGCVRWQHDPAAADPPGAAPPDAVCLLDVPVQKTGPAFTKPVDRVVGEAIAAWERERPEQPPLLDPKTGELVPFLFACRGRRVGEGFLNTTLIPALCRKAGVPERDARGAITSHRARSTIATQLFNAREPLSLFELQAWLGHSSPQSTQHYARITPTRLAKAYADAGYFARNARAIEVLVDQDAVRTGAAAAGAAWKFYDLGHGYCTYDFFDQCPHRMACAKCSFYVPKGSTRSQLLEGRTNLLRLRQEIPLLEEERAAVEDGLEALERLLTKLAAVPTPDGGAPPARRGPGAQEGPRGEPGARRGRRLPVVPAWAPPPPTMEQA
jgi:integrase